MYGTARMLKPIAATTACHADRETRSRVGFTRQATMREERDRKQEDRQHDAEIHACQPLKREQRAEHHAASPMRRGEQPQERKRRERNEAEELQLEMAVVLEMKRIQRTEQPADETRPKIRRQAPASVEERQPAKRKGGEEDDVRRRRARQGRRR